MSQIREHFTSSRDGTQICYLEQGSGPGILLIQGAGGTVENYAELASALETSYTVYSIERRGRGRSPKAYTRQYGIMRDVEDIEAVLTATGSNRLFGLSSGAVISLEAARVLPQITHVAVYVPPFYPLGKSMDGVHQLDRDIEAHDPAAAALTIMSTSEMTPRPFQVLPSIVSWTVLWIAMRINDFFGRPGYRFSDLVAASRFDLNVVAHMQDRVETFKGIRGKAMVMHGSKSRPFFAPAAKRVEAVVEGCERVESEDLDHSGPWNRRYGGSPDKVAQILVEFMR